GDVLAYHAAAVAEAIRSALASPREVVRASASWSQTMRDAFLVIAAVAPLAEIMKTGERASVEAAQLLVAGVAASGDQDVAQHLATWRHWLQWRELAASKEPRTRPELRVHGATDTALAALEPYFTCRGWA